MALIVIEDAFFLRPPPLEAMTFTVLGACFSLVTFSLAGAAIATSLAG